MDVNPVFLMLPERLEKTLMSSHSKRFMEQFCHHHDRISLMLGDVGPNGGSGGSQTPGFLKGRNYSRVYNILCNLEQGYSLGLFSSVAFFLGWINLSFPIKS